MVSARNHRVHPTNDEAIAEREKYIFAVCVGSAEPILCVARGRGFARLNKRYRYHKFALKNSPYAPRCAEGVRKLSARAHHPIGQGERNAEKRTAG